MTIYEVLQQTGLPCAYSHFKTPQDPPYLVYIGTGQDTDAADNTYRWKNNLYQVEYYFTQKSQANESAIEDKLLENGYNYTKSEDVYIEDEDVFVIYYQI
jgi:hypothetical protein